VVWKSTKWASFPMHFETYKILFWWFFWWMTISIEFLQMAKFNFFIYLFLLFLTNCYIKLSIFLRFGTFLVLQLREFFYAFPLVVIFILKVYTLFIFYKFKKISFLILKYSPKNHKYHWKCNKIDKCFLQSPYSNC